MARGNALDRLGRIARFCVRIGLVRPIDEGGMIAHGWGVAWRDYVWCGPQSVFLMPLPLSLLVSFVRERYFRALGGFGPHRYEVIRAMEMRARSELGRLERLWRQEMHKAHCYRETMERQARLIENLTRENTELLEKHAPH